MLGCLQFDEHRLLFERLDHLAPWAKSCASVSGKVTFHWNSCETTWNNHCHIDSQMFQSGSCRIFCNSLSVKLSTGEIPDLDRSHPGWVCKEQVDSCGGTLSDPFQKRPARNMESMLKKFERVKKPKTQATQAAKWNFSLDGKQKSSLRVGDLFLDSVWSVLLI